MPPDRSTNNATAQHGPQLQARNRRRLSGRGTGGTFPGAAQTSPLRPRLRRLLNEYLKESYVHSVRLVARPNASTLNRSLWLTCVVACGVIMLHFVFDLWMEFLNSPSELVLQETEQALWDFPFPSVTVCPRHKIRRSFALQFFARAINGSGENEELISHGLSAMERLQIPIRTDIMLLQTQLATDKAIDLMEGVDMAQVLAEALPTCKHVFRACYWAGREMDCCSIFDLQLTTRGLCYSFNSLTSFSRLKCQSPDDEGCQLISNSGTGSLSGLEIFLRHTSLSDQLLPDNPQTGFNVVVQSPLQIVDVERGIHVLEGRGEVTSAAVSFTSSRASPGLQNLPVETRGCLLPHEWSPRPHAPAMYSREGCLLECRADFARRMCGCQLHFASPPDYENVTTCGLGHLKCLAKIRANLLFVVPNPDGPGFSESERVPGNYPCCVHCRHPCTAAQYRTSYFIQPTGHLPGVKAAAYLDVYLRDRRSAILYWEKVRVKPHRLLVSYGGVFSLFLGISVLSVIQLIFFLGRAVAIVIHYYLGNDFGHRLLIGMCAAVQHGLGVPPTPPPAATATERFVLQVHHMDR